MFDPISRYEKLWLFCDSPAFARGESQLSSVASKILNDVNQSPCGVLMVMITMWGVQSSVVNGYCCRWGEPWRSPAAGITR
jgi:hypothetical protein